jgi:hypothetical protein
MNRRRAGHPIVAIYLTLMVSVALVVHLLAGNLVVDVWEDFDFTTLSVANLGADDHTSACTWTITDASSRFSMATNAERLLQGTINGLSDSGGTRGLSYDTNIADTTGLVTCAFSNRTNVSFGFWWFAPSGIAGSFGEHDIFAMETDLGTDDPFLKYADQEQGTGTGVRLHIFCPLQGYTTGVRLDTVALDTFYWVTVIWTQNTANGFKMRVYDVNGTLIGAEQLRNTPASDNLINMQIGTVIGGPQFVGSLRYDDLLADWTNHVFPIGPGVASGGGCKNDLLMRGAGCHEVHP